MLSFLYSPTLTSIHDYWKNHSFDYRTERCKSVFSEKGATWIILSAYAAAFSLKKKKWGVWVKITMMGVGEGHEGSEFQTYLVERGNQLRAEVVAVEFLWGNY